MRVLIAGASGAIGVRLVPQLIEDGHDVIGTSRSERNAERLRALGAEAVALDLLDPGAVRRVVSETRPDAIVHQATALADAGFTRKLDRGFAQTNRQRVVGQSFAPYRYARVGGPVKTEADPLEQAPPASARQTFAAMSHLEEAVTGAGGIALRYGGFYGAANDGLAGPVRKRLYPVIGDGGGVFSFTHLDDAAAATVLALDHDGPAIYNIVDDEPAPAREWLPVLAQALGAKPPRHMPAWLARLVMGGGLDL